MSEPKIQRHSEVRQRPLEDVLILYNPRTDEVTHLDAVAAVAWHELQYPHSSTSLIERLAELYQMPPIDIEADVTALIASLAGAQLIEYVTDDVPASPAANGD